MTGAMHSSTTMSLEPIRLKPGKIQIVLDTYEQYRNGKILQGFFQETADDWYVIESINQEI